MAKAMTKTIRRFLKKKSRNFMGVNTRNTKPPPVRFSSVTTAIGARGAGHDQEGTGVEMEAMMGSSVAALTVYDMLKSIDRGMAIGPTRLLEKSGGRSGNFAAQETP